MKSLIENLYGRKTKNIPFWFMRQAGRYLPEYRELRKQAGGFLNMVYSPEMACEITMQPIRRYGMNGAILFSDILVIPHALGQDVRFEPGKGPVLNALVAEKDLAILSSDKIDETLLPIYETVSHLSHTLRDEGFDDTALLGFAGAPWTVACYMIEGQGSKTFEKAKSWAYNNPESFEKLISILVNTTSHYLIKQIEAGAEAVQIFDSWAGLLDSENFHRWVITPTQRIVKKVKVAYPAIKIIGFPKNAGLFLGGYVQETGVDTLGLDYTIPLNSLDAQIPKDFPVQGNLDPAYLLGNEAILKARAQEILQFGQDRPFIFNLGHGVIKETKPEMVEALSQVIKNYER